ncbi:MAG: hypothetical protein QXO15_01120 [Nitrososphaerota archaeon]
MLIDETYIPKYYRLPSLTGRDIIELEKYAQLPRTKTYEKIQSFINIARMTKEVNVLFIRSEWGEGKSSIYEGFLRKPEVIQSDLVLRINTSRLILIIKEDYEKFLDTKSVGTRLFSILMYAIRDLLNNLTVDVDLRIRNIRLPDKLETRNSIEFINACLEKIFSAVSLESRLFIFLDEFEDIVDQDKDVQEFIIQGLVSIINGEPDILCGKGPYAGKIHLMIAITPPAYQTLVSKVTTFSNIGRLFGQRARVVELEKISREDAYRFILGCLKYCWNGNLTSLPFTEVGMLNAIYLLALGNPRGMVELIRRLLSSAEVASRQEQHIKLISPNDFIEYLSGEKITIHGGEIKIFDQEIINKVTEEVRRQANEQKLNPETALKFLKLLISSPVPLSKEYIIRTLDLPGDTSGLFHKYLNVIGASLNRVRRIHYPFLRFRKSMLNGLPDKLINKLNTQEQKILNALTFYELSNSNFELISKIFIPSDNLRELSMFNPEGFRQYVDYISSSLEEIIDENTIITTIDTVIRSEIEFSEEDYYMFSPAALSMFYTLPSIYFLDFIENIEDRFNIGMEILRRTSEYESEFHKGILHLLRDGLTDSEIRLEIESRGYSSLEVSTFTLKGLGNCQFRAHVFSILNWAEDSSKSIQEKLDLLKQFSVPLIIIFAWNFIPNDVRAVLESHKSIERLVYNICFILKTQHVYQIIARALAENKGLQIIESRWRARASQIIEELRVKNQIIDWIKNGEKEGYTLTPLYSAGKSVSDLVRAFRTFLITSGSCEERFKQIKDFDKLRIFGMEFPLNPLDISSEKSLFEYAQILSGCGFLDISEGGKISIVLTNIENRILQILSYFQTGIDLNDLRKMFVIYEKADLIPYINVLKERKRIIKDRTNVLKIRNINDLERELNNLRNMISHTREHYEIFEYGYLVSIKQRVYSLINVRECMEMLEKMLSELENLKYTSSELWLQKFIIFEKLSEHFLNNIYPKVRDFVKSLETIRNRTVSISMLERRIQNLKKDISHTLGFLEGRFHLKEESILSKLEKKIDEIRNRSFNIDEIRELLPSLGPKLPQKVERNLAVRLKGECYVFDIKILLLDDLYQELDKFASQINENIQKVENKLSVIHELLQQIRDHKLFTEDSVFDDIRISYTMLNMFREFFKKRYPDLLSNQYNISINDNIVEMNLNNLLENLERMDRKLKEMKNSCDSSYELINEISSLEKDFISLKNNLYDVINAFKEFYNDYTEILNELFLENTKLDKIQEDYNFTLNEIQRLVDEFENIEKISKICSNIRKSLEDKINNLKQINRKLDEIFVYSKDVFNSKLRLTAKMLEALERIVTHSDKESEILSHLSYLTKELESYNDFPRSKEEIRRSRSDRAFVRLLDRIDNLRQTIRKIFIEYDLLSDIELDVLEVFINTNVDRVNISLVLPDIMERVTSDFKLIGETILRLASLGLINIEVSL